MNQTTKAQAPKTLLSEYEKFHFLTHEDAKKAAMLLGEKYPWHYLQSITLWITVCKNWRFSDSLVKDCVRCYKTWRCRCKWCINKYVLSSSYSFIFICVLAIVRAWKRRQLNCWRFFYLYIIKSTFYIL